MKKLSLMMAALCAGMLFAAEFPDFAKAETWKPASWTKSNYSCADGVMTIERPKGTVPEGSGAWTSIAFPVTPGETITASADMHYISREEGSGCVRLGIDCVDAKGKRIKFMTGPQLNQVNAGFENKKFEVTIPEGTTKALFLLCIDNFGKAEFKNPVVK